MDAEKSKSDHVGDAKKTMPQGDVDKKILQEASKKTQMTRGASAVNTMSEDDAEALKKCLEENKGDAAKCKSKVEALKSSSPRRKQLTPLRLRSGSLTDV